MPPDLPPLDQHGLAELTLHKWTWNNHAKRFESAEISREPMTEMQARFLLWAWEHGGTRHPDDTAG